MGNKHLPATSVAGQFLLLAGGTRSNTLNIQKNGLTLKTHSAFQPKDKNLNTFYPLKISISYRTKRENRSRARCGVDLIQRDNEQSCISIQYIPFSESSFESKDQIVDKKIRPPSLTWFKISSNTVRKIDQTNPRIKGRITSNENSSAERFTTPAPNKTCLKVKENLFNVALYLSPRNDNGVAAVHAFRQRADLQSPLEKAAISGTFKSAKSSMPLPAYATVEFWA